MTRRRAVETDAKLPHRKLQSRTSGTEVPGLLAARFGGSDFDGGVRVGVDGASVKLPRIVGFAHV